jgi:uncharacterized SAM-binding protein YcdF (DUF218 family)
VKWKSFCKVLLTLGFLLLPILIAQTGYFCWILFSPNHIEESDVVVVFTGTQDRIKKGYELSNAGYATYLMISWANPVMLKDYDREYGLEKGIEHLVEDKAHTTFENALFTARIIKDRGFKSAILVTSSYHMPRSYFLLRLMLLGSSVKIYRYGLRSEKEGYLLDEMVRFWGSLGEGLCFILQ